MEETISQRLKGLRERAIENVERGFDELDLIFQKDSLVETGIVDTGKLRQLIQATKDLTDLFQGENGGKEDISQILKALEGENDT